MTINFSVVNWSKGDDSSLVAAKEQFTRRGDNQKQKHPPLIQKRSVDVGFANTRHQFVWWLRFQTFQSKYVQVHRTRQKTSVSKFIYRSTSKLTYTLTSHFTQF